MSADELNTFLSRERTCRVASSTVSGPHVVPLWFVWNDGALWLHSMVKSQRWADLARDPRVAVVIDRGESYEELRGVELRGTVGVIGEVPRVGESVSALVAVEAQWAEKYGSGAEMEYDGRHAWLRLEPAKIVSWDFRKLQRAGGQASN
jgi:hypothetical protein